MWLHIGRGSGSGGGHTSSNGGRIEARSCVRRATKEVADMNIIKIDTWSSRTEAPTSAHKYAGTHKKGFSMGKRG